MKITKVSVILFIFLLFVSIIPPMLGNNGIQSNQVNQSNDISPDQLTDPTNFGSDFVNASITELQRNVTVQFDAKVTLEDKFTLKILDNETKISTFNYTIPTVFANYLHEIKIFSQFDKDLGLVSPNNSRTYDVFYGKEATTFAIDITEDGFPANDSIDGVYFATSLTGFGMVDMSGHGTGQIGVFESPITPMFPNLGYKDALIGIGVSGSHDSFERAEIERFPNRLGTEMPQFTDVENRITYLNMSRSEFSYSDGLLDQDISELTFSSETPISQDAETEEISVVVPSVIDDADRVVRFDPWGKVYVEEQISVLHLGGERNITEQVFKNVHQLAGVLFTVDSQATITDVYDEFGSLELATRDEDTNYPDTTSSGIRGKQDLRIDFRNPIYGGDTYDFTVEYEYNASQVISVNNGLYTFNTTLFSDYNTTVRDMEVTYELPAGSVYQSNTYEANSRFIDYSISSGAGKKPLSSFSHYELTITAQNASYVDNVGFQIQFTYGLAGGHVEYTATFLYITIVLMALAYGMSSISYRPSKAIEIEKEQTPVDEMDAFFNLFSEKAGAEKRLSELRRQRIKGKLSKKDYDGKVKAIRRRLRDLNPELERAANKLSAKGGRYENYVKRVMLASQKQSDIRRNAREAKRAYERGSIPKNIYQIRIKEFNEELKKQETTINKTLTEMVELIQKYNQ